jgi:MYXO-CTERM domain-containing protein
MRSTFASIVLPAALLSVACSSPAPEPADLATASQAIQGGATTTEHPYAVGMTIGFQGICSGALIAPNLVLTARHCVANSPSTINCPTARFGSLTAGETGVYVTTGPNIQTAMSTRNFVRSSRIFVPSDTKVCGNDIALVVLSSNINNVPLVEPLLNTTRLITHANLFARKYTAIGYGLTNASGTPEDSGIRRILQDTPIGCIPGDTKSFLDCNKIQGTSGIITQTELIGGDGTCQGDSGSTAYEQTEFAAGRRLSLGVLSRGGAEGNNCVGAVYTRTDAFADLILQAASFAQQQGGYPKPAWLENPDRGSTTPGGGGGGTVTPPPNPGGTIDLGGSCSGDTQCKSGSCLARTSADPFVCSQACDESNACPDGFGCDQGYCFEGFAPPETVVTTTTTTGCAIAAAPAPERRPLASFAALAALAGLVFARRRKAR